jgi:hypothetical protein
MNTTMRVDCRSAKQDQANVTRLDWGCQRIAPRPIGWKTIRSSKRVHRNLTGTLFSLEYFKVAHSHQPTNCRVMVPCNT